MSEKKDPLEGFHPLPPKIVPEMTAGQAKAYAVQVGSGHCFGCRI